MARVILGLLDTTVIKFCEYIGKVKARSFERRLFFSVLGVVFNVSYFTHGGHITPHQLMQNNALSLGLGAVYSTSVIAKGEGE